jgi:Ca-activated chloride channel family protein
MEEERQLIDSGTPRPPIRRSVLAAMAVFAVLASSCSGGTDDTSASDVDLGDPGDCIVVDITVSSEKIELINALAKEYNEQGDTVSGGTCIFVRPQKRASGAAAQQLAAGWDEQTDGPMPVIWSPASSAWGAITNQRLLNAGEEPIAPDDATPFMLTPLTIAMPEPMAEALGYPDQPISFADIVTLSQDPQGWATYGHPEWGPFRLGKTNPNFSTSGLSALIAQNYAAVGKTSGLSGEDLANPAVIEFGTAIENSVVHYGDTTLTFLNNWYRADRSGTALTYASAAAVEEKSILDYNAGNPDGILEPGEEPVEPRIPLVAVYPSEGTLYSDNPFFILDAPWVSADQTEAAEKFQAFVQLPENQEKVLEFGFRPGNPDVEIAAPITAANGVDPLQPETLLEVPQPEVMIDLLDAWDRQRKGARVLMVLDVSGSMGEQASAEGLDTKLDLAKSAAVDALDAFKAEDLVGLRVFSTDLGPDQTEDFLDLTPIEPIGANSERMAREIEGLFPRDGTPLFGVTLASFQQMVDEYDPNAINAILLLSDGQNDDGNPDDDERQREELLAELRNTATGEGATPVRIFTIAYGADADLATLSAIAEATDAATYSATDPTTIDKVFAEVVSNF